MKAIRKKAKLIAEGRLPLEYHKDDHGNIIGDNGGEPWMIYYIDLNVFRFSWWKHRVKNNDLNGSYMYPIKTIPSYYFRPTKDNRLLLNKTLKEKEELQLL